MPWHAHLNLDYRLDAQRTVLRHQHDGPLRIFKSLYPEGNGICHNVIIHPPGGLVGGDVLDVQVHVGSGAHGLISTPGATRFYASDGPPTTRPSDGKKPRVLSQVNIQRCKDSGLLIYDSAITGVHKLPLCSVHDKAKGGSTSE